MPKEQDQKFYTSILIIGKDRINLHMVKRLFNHRENYLIIGDGERPIEEILENGDLDKLIGKVGPSTIWNIAAHGESGDGHYVDNVRTDILLSHIDRIYEGAKPVHLYSCKAEDAKEYVDSLSTGSVFIAHGEEFATLQNLDNQMIFDINVKRDSTIDPALEFANNLFNNAAHTVTFSQTELVKGSIIKNHFLIKPEEIENDRTILVNPEKILECFDRVREKFIEQKNVKKENINPLTRRDAEIWARRYFEYLISKNDKKLIEALEKSIRNSRFKSLIDNDNSEECLSSTVACQFAFIEMIKALIANDAILDAPPLTLAIKTNNNELFKKICEDLSFINYQDRDGYTALHFAASEGDINVINFLASKGADLDITNNDGYTASDLAELEKHGEAVELLAIIKKYKQDIKTMNNIVDAKTDASKKDEPKHTVSHIIENDEDLETAKTSIDDNSDFYLKDKNLLDSGKFINHDGIEKTLINIEAGRQINTFIKHRNTATGLFSSCMNYMQVNPFTSLLTLGVGQLADIFIRGKDSSNIVAETAKSFAVAAGSMVGYAAGDAIDKCFSSMTETTGIGSTNMPVFATTGSIVGAHTANLLTQRIEAKIQSLKL